MITMKDMIKGGKVVSHRDLKLLTNEEIKTLYQEHGHKILVNIETVSLFLCDAVMSLYPDNNPEVTLVPSIDVVCFDPTMDGDIDDAIYGVNHFHPSCLDSAIDCLRARLESENPKPRMEPCLDSLSRKDFAIIHKKDIRTESHYDYLDRMLELFFLEVFGKTATAMFCGGMASAHGDKAYGYQREWAKHGIDKYRGTLLFLLTYTSAMDRPKHESCEWVIEQYPKYEPILQEIETKLFNEQYGRYVK